MGLDKKRIGKFTAQALILGELGNTVNSFLRQ